MKRVLIADDDAQLCGEVAEMLGGEGYAADTALDGGSALGLAGEHRYDVVLLDYRMPGPGILETLTGLRERQPDARILVISGRPFLEKLMEDRRLASLSDGTVGKPFSPEALLEAMRTPG